MKRILLIIGALLFSLAVRAQSVTYTCRYWFDQNDVQAVTTAFGENGWEMELDVGSLADGLHTLHLNVLAADTVGVLNMEGDSLYFETDTVIMKWSAPQNYLFLKTTATPTENYVFHHWIDQGQMQSSAIGNGQFLLDVATLDAGLHTLHVVLKGSEYTASQNYIFLKPELTGFDVENWIYHCWFDEDYAHRETDSLGNGNFLLDVSGLEEGLHTLNVILRGNSLTATQSYMFMRVEMVETDSIDMSNLTYSCWFDQDYEQRATDSLRDGNILLDVADLTDGLHTVNVMLQGGTGTLTSARTYMFMKVTVEDPSIEQQYRCWFDEDHSTVQTGMLGGGIFQLEVSDLSNGLHIVNVQLEKSTRTAPQSYFFYKIPFGGNGLNKWEYCVNNDWANRITTNVVPSVDTLSIISLLPVPPQPVRSSCFHFHPNGDEPYLNAKNEITLRFWTADDHFIDNSAFYVDEYVSEPIQADDLERNTMVCIPAPRDNQMQWYKVPLVVGDSIAFRSDKACTMQLFAPSGEEVYAATASEALAFGGIHAWEDGDYYLVVHDVTGSGDEICLTNVYVHKYAILAYDVHLVGNGGCSTITFQGNGFNSLLDAYLVNVQDDTIRSVYKNHESNTEIPIVFNFYEVALGMYDAVFQFYGETIRVNNAIQVEEPVDMVLTANVTYPSQFLRNTVVTYNIDITNNGNMSAYGVPIYVYVSTPTMNGISHLEFEGLGLSSLVDYFDLDSLSLNEIEELNAWSTEMGDDHYFFKSLGIDEVNGDSIAIRTNYFFVSVGARKTNKLKLKIKSNESPTVKVTVPNDPVPPKTLEQNNNNSPQTCIVSYNCNGGTGCPADQIVAKWTTITLADAPTKEGYTFYGWNRGHITSMAGDTYMVRNDITFTARWTPVESGDTTRYCTVYYNCNGGVGGCPPDSIWTEVNTTITLPSAPRKPDYSFYGWNDGNYTYQEGASYQVTNDVTFTALWKSSGGDDPNPPGPNPPGPNPPSPGNTNPYCCAREQIQCTLDALCTGMDILSMLPSLGSGGMAVAECICEAFSLLNRNISRVICEEDSGENYWNSNEIIKQGSSILGTIGSCIQAANPAEKIKDFMGHLQSLANLVDFITNGQEPDCIEKWKKLKQDCPDGDTDGGESEAVTSLDPNDIRGYLSESGSHYMRQEIQNVQYEIEFENDTALATAAAHTIIVRDTLNRSRFDLNSLAARSVTIGDKRLDLNGEQTFARTLDLRPEQYVIAQINQDYDPATGIIQWTIQSLDPMTMEPTDDPNQGVLPVNYNGNGVGFIDYSVNLKQAFADGTKIKNRAGIIFDQEDVIMTPIWTNIVDAVKPTSHIEEVEVVNDSLSFSFVSSDNRSGVWYHTLYHRNDSTYQEWQVRKPQVFGNCLTLPIDSLFTTEYLVIAVDSAGNHEEKEMVAEYTYFSSVPTTVTQSNALSRGWNWYSTYIEQEGIDGLGQLENSISVPKAIIQSQGDGYVKSILRNGSVLWGGALSSINNEEMYKIGTKYVCTATMEGVAADPANHPITINKGWNWIGFPCDHSLSVSEALSGFTPKNKDVIKGLHSYSTYRNGTWQGTLNTLEPGQGYMYGSGSNATKTLVFNSGRGKTTKANITPENNFYQPVDDYADNMTLTAIVELDGEELHSEDYELAAFVGDECRGSVKLMYVESLNRYVAFLTVFGDEAEDMHFVLTDGATSDLSADYMTYATDGIVGTLDEPVVLRFGATDVNENALANVRIYPNPSNGVFNVEGVGIRKVEVTNAFGQVILSEEVKNDNLQINLSGNAAGAYLLRVVTDRGVATKKLVKE